MQIILSPAKNMRRAVREDITLRKPLFQQQTEQLAAALRGYSHFELETLMKINPKLALGAYLNFQDFDWNHVGLPSLLAYDGLVFKNIEPEHFTTAQYQYADEHVWVLSAFYGMLRPCDGIMPYRLEMICPLKIDGKNLYQFWGDGVYRQLFAAGEPVLNLASAEYSKLVTPYLKEQDRLITIDFRTMRQGKLRTVTTSAKMARGQMTAWIVRNGIDRPQEVQQFTWDGYTYAPQLSDERTYVFIQQQTGGM